MLTACDQIEYINPLFLLTAKPVVYLCNVSENDYVKKKTKKYLMPVAKWIEDNSPGDVLIPISICLEERLAAFETEEEVKEELKKLGVNSALPKCITTMRKALDLGSFFTTGTDEVRQWTIRNGTKAPQAAGVIHGDFEKTFIQVIVYNFSALKEFGDEGELKAKGKILTKGKDYVVEDVSQTFPCIHSPSLNGVHRPRALLFRFLLSLIFVDCANLRQGDIILIKAGAAKG
jgi:obg-like ATPase 1